MLNVWFGTTFVSGMLGFANMPGLRCWRNFYFYFSRFRMIIDPPAAAAAINKNGLQRVNVLVDFFTQDLVMVI